MTTSNSRSTFKSAIYHFSNVISHGSFSRAKVYPLAKQSPGLRLLCRWKVGTVSKPTDVSHHVRVRIYLHVLLAAANRQDIVLGRHRQRLRVVVLALASVLWVNALVAVMVGTGVSYAVVAFTRARMGTASLVAFVISAPLGILIICIRVSGCGSAVQFQWPWPYPLTGMSYALSVVAVSRIDRLQAPVYGTGVHTTE